MFFSKKKKELKAYLSGKAIDITEVSDPVFSSKSMGDGMAIVPTDNVVVSPIDGEISVTMPSSNHACGINGEGGLGLLIHIGIDTVSLNGEGFECLVKEGDKVKVGQPLIKFNSELIKEKGFEVVTMLVIVEEGNSKKMEFKVNQNVVAGKDVIGTFQ